MNEITTTERQFLLDFLIASAPVSDELFAEIVTFFKRQTYKKGDCSNYTNFSYSSQKKIEN